MNNLALANGIVMLGILLFCIGCHIANCIKKYRKAKVDKNLAIDRCIVDCDEIIRLCDEFKVESVSILKHMSEIIEDNNKVIERDKEIRDKMCK